MTSQCDIQWHHSRIFSEISWITVYSMIIVYSYFILNHSAPKYLLLLCWSWEGILLILCSFMIYLQLLFIIIKVTVFIYSKINEKFVFLWQSFKFPWSTKPTTARTTPCYCDLLEILNFCCDGVWRTVCRWDILVIIYSVAQVLCSSLFKPCDRGSRNSDYLDYWA